MFRRTDFIAVAAGGLAAIGMVGCGSTAGPQSTATSGSSSISTSAPPPTTGGGSTAVTATTAPSGGSLPVSVQSDQAMKAAGNSGPSSSILVPTSCDLVGDTATATGGYQGGLAAEVYPRYGDIVDLYVFSAPETGYPDGIQLAELSSGHFPAIGGRGPWTATVPIDASLGQPVRCLVAAQPTHDFEGSPSAY